MSTSNNAVLDGHELMPIQRSGAMRRWLPLLVLAMIMGVNLVPFNRGSIAFDKGQGFSCPRGWPFSAFAGATDEGASLVDASVVQGDTRVSRNALPGPYPHLAWNPLFFALNLIVAAVLMAAAYLLAARLGKAAQQADAADRPPAGR